MARVRSRSGPRLIAADTPAQVPSFGAASVIVLSIILAAWMLLSAGLVGGEPSSGVTLLLAMVTVFAVSYYLSQRWDWVVVAGIMALSALLAARNFSRLLNAPLDNPLNYSNATAAFFVLAAAASLILMVRSKFFVLRMVALALAVGFGAIPLLNGSAAGRLLVMSLPLGLLAGSSRLRAQRVIYASASVVAMVLAITITLGLTHNRLPAESALSHVIAATLSERRPALWQESLTMMSTYPITGVGARRFGDFSPTAQEDTDARWSHNGFLHLGAEHGVVAFTLAIGLVAAAFATILNGRLDAGSAIAALGLMAFAVHGSIDYTWHFGQVSLAVSALVGAGAAGSPARLSLDTAG